MTRSTLIWIGIGASVAILILLGLWMLFLRGEQSILRDVSLGRGLGDGGVPTFSGDTGSTNELLRTGMFERAGVSSDSSAGARENTGATTTRGSDASSLSFDTPRLWQLSGVPSAGVSTIGASSTLRMRFVERPSGNVFDANPYSGTVTRVTNTLIPQVYEAHFPDSERVILRHLTDDARSTTFMGEIVQSTSTNTGTSGERTLASLSGTYFDEPALSLAVANGRIFTITRPDEQALGRIQTDTAANAGTRIFTSAIAHWRSTWLDAETLLLVQRAANGVAGSALLLDTDGATEPLLRGIDGLTAVVNREQNALLYSESAGAETTLYAQPSIPGTAQALSLETLAEKCVFDPQNALTAYCAVPQEIPDVTLPDAWYRGEVHFSDVWWRIDLADNTSEFLLSPESEYGIALDVYEPRVNEAGTHILFLDARTRTPWALRIAE